jgi:hypothetical protein
MSYPKAEAENHSKLFGNSGVKVMNTEYENDGLSNFSLEQIGMLGRSAAHGC